MLSLDLSVNSATLLSEAGKFPTPVIGTTENLVARRAKSVKDSGVFLCLSFSSGVQGGAAVTLPLPVATKPVVPILYAARSIQIGTCCLSGISTNLSGDSAMSNDTQKPKSISWLRKRANPLRINTYRLRQAVRKSIAKQFPDKPEGYTIDHRDPPFWVLRDEWFHAVGLDPKQTLSRPAFEQLKRHWIEFHNARCNRENGGLVLTTEAENLLRSHQMQAMIAAKKRGGGV